MDENLEYIRVRVSKIIYYKREYDIVNGERIYHPDFITKLQDEDADFREPIITFINDAVGTHNWAVHFGEFIENKKFDVSIFCETDEDYFIIRDIIRERITKYNFNFFARRGRLSDYMNSQ